MSNTKYLKRILRIDNRSNTVNYDVVVLNLKSDVIFTGTFICDKYDGTFNDDIRLSLGIGKEHAAFKYNARPAELLHYKCPHKVSEYYDLLCMFDGYTELDDEEMNAFESYFRTVNTFYASHGYM